LLPIINVNSSFTDISIKTYVVGTIITVQMNFIYTDNGSDDGLSFGKIININGTDIYVYQFYNFYSNLTIIDFGNIPLSRNSQVFSGSPSQFSGTQTFMESGLNNIIFNTITAPKILSNTYLSLCFNGMQYFNSNISNWNTSNVIDLSLTFFGCIIFNNGDVSGGSNNPLSWDVSNVKSLYGTFAYCFSFNQSISNWNVSNVHGYLDMYGTFYNCSSFNQNIGMWDTSSVTGMGSTFYQCNVFNNGEIGNTGSSPLNWNTSMVIDMSNMFKNCSNFNQPITYDISNNFWNTSSVTNMEGMFLNASLFNNGYLIEDNTHLMNWNISMITLNSQFGTGSLLTFYPSPGTSNNNMFSSW